MFLPFADISFFCHKYWVLILINLIFSDKNIFTFSPNLNVQNLVCLKYLLIYFWLVLNLLLGLRFCGYFVVGGTLVLITMNKNSYSYFS